LDNSAGKIASAVVLYQAAELIRANIVHILFYSEDMRVAIPTSGKPLLIT
jgi:hypothetical protein